MSRLQRLASRTYDKSRKGVKMNTYPQEMQVKQFVAVVQGKWGKFMVFKTGNPQFYLFSALDKFGCQTGLQFPVLKTNLKNPLRKALKHGWGNGIL